MSRGSQGAITLLGIAAGLAFGVLIGGGAPSQASRAPAGVDAPRPIPGAVARPPDVMKR
jgi:hypothetical protein